MAKVIKGLKEKHGSLSNFKKIFFLSRGVEFDGESSEEELMSDAEGSYADQGELC